MLPLTGIRERWSSWYNLYEKEGLDMITSYTFIMIRSAHWMLGSAKGLFPLIFLIQKLMCLFMENIIWSATTSAIDP